MEDILKELEQIVNDAGKVIDKEYDQSQIELLVASSKRMRETLFAEDDELKSVLMVGTYISKADWDRDESMNDGSNTVGPTYEQMIDMSSQLKRCGMKAAIGVKSVSHMLDFFEEQSMMCVLYEKTNYISLLLGVQHSLTCFVTYMTTESGIGVMRERDGHEPETWYVTFDPKGRDHSEKISELLTEKQNAIASYLCQYQQYPAKTKREYPKLWEGLMELTKSHHPDMFDDNDDTE